MKVKYYLRGMGVGILITTLIFAVSYAIQKPKMSDEEIIAAAKQLGMVEAEAEEDRTSVDSEESDTDTTEELTETEDSSDTSGTVEDTETDVTASTEASSAETADTTTNGEASSAKTVDFSVNHGETSHMVSENLYNLGLVDDADAFDKYLNSNNYDNFVQPGSYTIPEGSSYEEVATIITQGKLN
ncbi:YceG-like family protein [Lachnospiraceae bacterium A10]|jgi:cytoskeletal protein RodZ|nr:YceG-like family protein [Lachnospiraceae bacterium A10]